MEEFLGTSVLNSELLLQIIHDFINAISDISLHEVSVHYINTSTLRVGRYYKILEQAL